MTLKFGWLVWALLSATFAALTAIFAKIGVANVNPDVATFVRTVVILAALFLILCVRGLLQQINEISLHTLAFLALSGLATGASWLCYFRALQIGDAALVAPIDKLGVVLVAIFGVTFLGESLSVTNWIGIAMMACGAVLVALR